MDTKKLTRYQKILLHELLTVYKDELKEEYDTYKNGEKKDDLLSRITMGKVLTNVEILQECLRYDF